jgi:hypothetical protein
MNEAGNEVRSVTDGLPDWDVTRRNLIALRVKHGAASPIGHRCSNIVGQLENYQQCPAGTERLALRNLMEKQMAGLERLLAAEG